MKQLMCLAIVTLVLTGCEIEVEIPTRRAGVAITNEGEVQDEVLGPGKHIIRTDSEVILYDVTRQQLENDFDVLFKDGLGGDVRLLIEFTPLVDSLPGFYKAYKSIYVDLVVDLKSRWTVRKLLENYNPTQLNKDEFGTKIIDAITSNRDITNYVELHKVQVVDLRW